MKRLLITASAIALLSSPALAMKVTNLDHVPHKVLFTQAGAKDVREIAPGDTEYFAGAPQGTLSLLSAQNPKPSRGTLHADGLLSGVIGAERTENMPADTDDSFVIWPDGKLSIQSRKKTSDRHH